MKLHQFYTRTISRPEPLNANGKEPGAEMGQSWDSFWAGRLAGRWHDHGHAGKYADMPRRAVGKKRYQVIPNDTKIKAMLEIKNCAKLDQIVPKKLNQTKPK